MRTDDRGTRRITSLSRYLSLLHSRWLVRFVSAKMTDVTTRTLPHWHYVAKDVMHRAPHEPNVRTPASGAVSQFCPYVDACQLVKGSPVVLVFRANFNFRHGTF
jgi:hypothetical protein